MDNKQTDPKKNRMSFKQFQQHYQQQTIISKQKRKSQQQQLQKLAANNVKPLQNNNSKERVSIVDLSKYNKSSGVSQHKNSAQSLSLTQLNSLNSSIAFPSNFVSPKASTNSLMKSISLASNKSKQLAKNNFNSLSKEKFIDAKLNILPKHNTVINLNCGNQKNLVNKNIPLKQDRQQIQRKMKKISSISKITTTDVGESFLLSFPSQKILEFTANDLTFEEEKQSESLQQTLKYVNYLVSEINFLNQVFKELQNQRNAVNQQLKLSQLSYKSKLLAQIRTKLDKQSGMFGVSMKHQQNPIKSLHQAVLTLLNNYQSDIKHVSSKQQNTDESKCQSKHSKMPLSININNDQPHIDLQLNQKRQQSKKKTIKLSKSRKTHQQTINSQSKVRQYFQTSQFSILNTSKITQVSRPSSQNKNLPYMNEIEHVIQSKILDKYDNDNNSNNNEQRPKYDLGNRVRVGMRDQEKGMGKENWGRKLSSQIQKDTSKETQKNGRNLVKGQSCEETRKKVVSKTIHLVSNNTSIDKPQKQISNKQYPSVPKCTKIPVRPTKQNTNTTNLPAQPISFQQTSNKVKSITIGPQKTLSIKPQHQDSPAPSQSHNQSIYQLQFLQNYPGFNVPSDYSSIEPKYSQELFK